MNELQKMQVDLATKVVKQRMPEATTALATLDVLSVSESETVRITVIEVTWLRKERPHGKAKKVVQVTDSKIDGSIDLMEPGAKVDQAGRIAVRVASDTVCYLSDDGTDQIRGLKKLAKELGKNGQFTVYMGHATEDQRYHVTRAIETGVEVFPLDSSEEWGYDFIAVRNRVIPGTEKSDKPLRYDPLQSLNFWNEMEVSENDYRDPLKKVRLGDFLWAARKIQGGEIPAMIQAQMHTLSQMVEVQ